MQPDPKGAGPDASRKAILAALVALQDCKVPVVTSRQQVAESFRVTYQLVAEVEREGLANEWPPL
jgi:hypothetical protein